MYTRRLAEDHPGTGSLASTSRLRKRRTELDNVMATELLPHLEGVVSPSCQPAEIAQEPRLRVRDYKFNGFFRPQRPSMLD